MLQVALFKELVFSHIQVIEEIPKSFFPDLLAGGSLMQFVNYKTYWEITHPYVSTELKWFVPYGKSNSRQGHISNVFKWSLWVVIGVTFLVAVVVCHFLQHNNPQSSRRISTTCLNLWAALMLMGIPRVPSNLRMRLYLLLWLIYASALNTVFQAFFTLFLVDPGYQKHISTLQEMVDSGIQYGGFYNKYGSWCLIDDYTLSVCLNATFRCSTDAACIYK